MASPTEEEEESRKQCQENKRILRINFINDRVQARCMKEGLLDSWHVAAARTSSFSSSLSPPEEDHMSVRTKFKKVEWLPAGKDLVPEAEYCPEAITDYINAEKSSNGSKNLLALNARKHLSFLGWKIDFRRDEKHNANRLRYTSPENFVSFSLKQVCLGLEPESPVINSISEDKRRENVGESVSSVSEANRRRANVGAAVSSVSEANRRRANVGEAVSSVSEANRRRANVGAAVSSVSAANRRRANVGAAVSSVSEANRRVNVGAADNVALLTRKPHPYHGGSEILCKSQDVHETRDIVATRVYVDDDGREYVNVEGQYCPQAVAKYVSFEDTYDRSSECRNAGKEAKSHLSAVGWKFFLHDKGYKKELRYVAPCGKVFTSLRQACVWYVSDENHSLSKKSTSKRLKKSEKLKVAQPRALGPLPPVLHHERNLTRCYGFSTNQSTVSSSVSQSLNQLGVIRTRGIDSRVSMQTNIDNDLLRKHEKVIHDANTELKASQMGTPLAHKTPSTILSWLIDVNAVLPGAKVYYRRKDGTCMQEGRITRAGIECSCCQCVFTLSKFEAHAGSTYHRPAASIFLEDGRSLREIQLQLNNNESARSKKSDSHRAKKEQKNLSSNDQICSSCRFGGVLLLCDRCPSSFHTSCLGLKEVPDGEWFCPSCCCGICNSRKCKDDQLLICAQCDLRYHLECLRTKGNLTHDGGYPEGEWYCNTRCEQIYTSLQNLVGKPVPVGANNLTWTLLKNDPKKDQDMEIHSKLKLALEVMHECFEPVKEPLTGRDLAEDVIFSRGSNLNRLNFQGFYTLILEKDEKLVTVATVRICGEKVAEIPLVATRFQFRRLGMCRMLMDLIEKKLMELGVERLVLTSAPAVLNTWTSCFGFSVMSRYERLNLMRYSFLEFQGTIMCLKLLTNGKPCDSRQVKENQQNESEQINIVDSMDGVQADGNTEIETIQLSSIGIGCKRGNDFVPLDVMVRNDSDGNTEKTGTAARDDGPFRCYKRRKVSVC